MNFLEAMATGKRFKRKDWAWYTTGIQQGEHVPYTAEGLSLYWIGGHHVNAEELLADDWEVEEEKIEITYSQLYGVLNGKVGTRPEDDYEVAIDILEVWKRLGGSR
jgi:hypothetical protein